MQHVPHIRLRTSTSSSSTTVLLVLDNVVSSDAGVYQCSAQDGLDTASGNELNVTGEYLVIVQNKIKTSKLLFASYKYYRYLLLFC